MMLSKTSSHSLASLKAIALNVLALLFVLSAFSVSAVEDKFSFDTPAQRESFLKLTAELRCPMCQNQNIACLLYTSPSPRDRQKSRMPSSA